MDGLKRKLAALKLEENELSDKVANLDSDIRASKERNDSLQYEWQSLVSSEKLLNLKIENNKTRLSNIEAKLKSHEHRLSLGTSVTADYSSESAEERLEAELNEKKNELRTIGAQYAEAIIHLQQVEAEQKRKEQRAIDVEKDVSILESQHSKIKEAWNKVESISVSDDRIEELKVKIKELQQQLETAHNNIEHSEREIVRLNRSIASHHENLVEEKRAHEKLKREFDSICSELQAI